MCTARKNTSLSKSKKNKTSSLVMLPLDFTPKATDILCGRGNVFSNHDGNRYFGRIIRANLKQYRDAVSRPEKIRVVDNILQDIRSEGVRFAKLDNETKRWYELNDVLAHQKIGHAIRDTIRLLKDKTKTNKTNTFKQPRIAKRKRQPAALQLKNHVVPSSDTRKKTMDDILRMSFETSEFLNGIWGDSENTPPQTQSTAETFEVKSEMIQPVRKSRFSLEDEFPEESFDFSPNSFFGEYQNYDVLTPLAPLMALPARITSQ
jgi:hypothetical protein